MKNTLSLVTAAFIILFASCKKETSIDQSTGGGTTASLKVKSYTESLTSSSGNLTATFNLTYDANNRIVSAVSAPTPDFKFLYGYPSSNKITMDLIDAGALSIHEDYFLNSNSLIDSTFQYNDTQDTLTEKYFYNVAKQQIRTIQYDYSKLSGSVLFNTIDYTYNTSGNLIQSVDSDNDVDDYEYYADLIYISPVITGLPNPDAGQKRNLVKKHTLTSSGTVVGSAAYTYTFDAQNRISTETQTITDGRVIVKTYTYF